MTSLPPIPGALMDAEIREQPESWSRFCDSGLSTVTAIGRELRSYRPPHIFIAARGTSSHAGMYARYLSQTLLGIPCSLLTPAAFTIYEAQPQLAASLVVGVSQSGGSPDLLHCLSVAQTCGATTVAITNDSDSPLAKIADYHIDLCAGPELAIAATKSYTCQLLALYCFLHSLHGSRDYSEIFRLPELASNLLEQQNDIISSLAQRFRFATHCVTTARGYSYATAQETALKLMESSYLFSLSYSSADLLHGPLAAFDHSTPVLVTAGPGKAGEAVMATVERLRQQGTDLFCVGSRHHVQTVGSGLVLPETLSEELSPLLEILPAQVLALRLALLRNINPDSPRALSKVTKTL